MQLRNMATAYHPQLPQQLPRLLAAQGEFTDPAPGRALAGFLLEEQTRRRRWRRQCYFAYNQLFFF